MTRNAPLIEEAVERVARTHTPKQLRRDDTRTRRQRSRELEPPESDRIDPTPERARHDPIERLERAPFDEHGPDSRPSRVKDRWVRMEAAGSIDAGMRRAAHRFRRDFAVAGLEALRAGPLLRLPRTGRAADPSELRLDARQAVWAALEALGGSASPSGSIVWHCVGRDETVKEWALRQSWSGRARLNETAAKGVMLTALWTLAEHYRRRDKAARTAQGA
jgi:hypothetical protein